MTFVWEGIGKNRPLLGKDRRVHGRNCQVNEKVGRKVECQARGKLNAEVSRKREVEL